MDYIEQRFINLKIEILKLTVFLTAILGLVFFIFHLIFCNGTYKFAVIFSDFLLSVVSIISFKKINEKNYYFFAFIEFGVLLFAIVMLSIVYPTNVYLPIWMFGTLIVFVLTTNIISGMFLLFVTVLFFDFLFINRVDLYSFITLNLQFVAYFIFGIILIKKLKQLQEKIFFYEKLLYENSIKDTLTKIYNRNYFEKTAKLLLEKAKRNNKKVLFLMIDIDYFKKINDTYGHPVGDLVLIEVAQTIKNNLRKSDLFARIGGEEFAILIDEYKEENNIPEKLRKAIENLKISVNNEDIKITISIGGVVSKNYDYEYLYKRADEALYEAKRERNKIVIFKE